MNVGIIVSKLISRNASEFFRLGAILDTLYSSLQQKIQDSLKTKFNQCLNNNDKQKILEDVKKELSNILTQLNTIKNSLSKVNSSLGVIQNVSSTYTNIIPVINSTVNIIKSIPIPTAPIPVPVSFITTGADLLDKLGKNLNKIEKGIEIIPSSIDSLQQLTSTAINSINKILNYIQTITKDISVLELQLNNNLDPTEDQIKNQQNSILDSIGYFNPISNTYSTPNDNILLESELNQRLQPNSNNPIIYKGFLITVETEANSDFPQRRLRGEGVENDTSLILYNQWTSDLSWSYSSLEVLLSEIQFRIDVWLNGDDSFFENYYNVSTGSVEFSTSSLDLGDYESPPQTYTLNIDVKTYKENEDFSLSPYISSSFGGKILVNENPLSNSQIKFTTDIKNHYKTLVNLKAIPTSVPSCSFKGWGGKDISKIPINNLNDSDISFDLKDNLNLEANFIYNLPIYNLTLIVKGNGNLYWKQINNSNINNPLSQVKVLKKLNFKKGTKLELEFHPLSAFGGVKWKLNGVEVHSSSGSNSLISYYNLTLEQDTILEVDYR